MIDIRTTAMSLGFLLVACSPGGNQEREAAQADSTAADSTGGMAGMDHSNMPGMSGADSSISAAGTMEGMDHANTPGMGSGASATRSAAAMDHSNMPGMSGSGAAARSGSRAPAAASAIAGMDHSRMANPAPRAGASGRTAMDHAAMPGMDHASMPGMATANNAADAKLVELISLLATDPVVLRRIQADSVLRNRWANPALRRLLER